MSALAKDIMGGGFSPAGAQAINGQFALAVSAAGTTISDATQLKATNNTVTTVASGAGVLLYDGVIGDTIYIYNGGANALKVYPPTSSQTINQLSAGTAISLGVNTAVMLKKFSATAWIGWLSA